MIPKKRNLRTSNGEFASNTTVGDSNDSASDSEPPRPKRKTLSQISANASRRASAPEYNNSLMAAPLAFMAAATESGKHHSSPTTVASKPRDKPKASTRVAVSTASPKPSLNTASTNMRNTTSFKTNTGSTSTSATATKPRTRASTKASAATGGHTNSVPDSAENIDTTSEDESGSERTTARTTFSTPTDSPAVAAALAAAEALKNVAKALNEASVHIFESVNLSYLEDQPSPSLSRQMAPTS